MTSSYELEQKEAGVDTLVHLEVGGQLDLTNAVELEERLAELSATDGTRLVLDLNRVVFVDSAALHVLFRIARRLGRERFGIVLDPATAIGRTVEIVGLSKVVTLAGSAEALGPAFTRS